MPTVNQIAAFLDRFFAAESYPDEPGGIVRPSARPIRRLGLALEPRPGLADWAGRDRLDALFLHRPWKLPPDALPADIGILSYHLSFDERLTLGFNPRLADALGMADAEALGHKEGRPLGMIGAVPPQAVPAWGQALRDVFGGLDETAPHAAETVTRVAVVGAMTDALVREAARRGADTYVTGQFRHPARLAVHETGLGVCVVGHRRSEEWGLRALAGVLRERWASLQVFTSS